MTLVDNSQTWMIIGAAVALVVVLLLIMRSITQRRIVRLGADVGRLTGERDAIAAERDRLLIDLDTARAQIRPLSDEVDRLKRAEAKRLKVNEEPTLDAPAPIALSDDSNLSQLKGVGEKFAAKLRDQGITSIRQIAGWTSADAAVMDSQLAPFQGRIMRDRLVEQAKLLHEGRITEYETRFGKLGEGQA